MAGTRRCWCMNKTGMCTMNDLLVYYSFAFLFLIFIKRIGFHFIYPFDFRGVCVCVLQCNIACVVFISCFIFRLFFL